MAHAASLLDHLLALPLGAISNDYSLFGDTARTVSAALERTRWFQARLIPKHREGIPYTAVRESGRRRVGLFGVS